MKWNRAKIPLNVTKNNLDPFEYFFNRQKEQETSNVIDTPITDEGIQNVDDAASSPNDADKAPFIKVTYEKIPYEFFSKLVGDPEYLEWIGDSQVPEKFLLNKYIKDKQDIPILLFEDFNTTGIQGDWNHHEPKLPDGRRNDYNIFFWYSGNPVNKGNEKGGGVGVGRLTFAFSSKINTFFSFSVRKDKSKFFIGMSCLGKSSLNPSYDQIARYGISDKAADGSEIVKPVDDNETLKIIHKGLKLKRGFDEPGTSMCVILPTDSLKANHMTLNAIDRYRYAFNKRKMKGMEILKYKIDKSEMLNTIQKLAPKDHKRYKDYFTFLDQCHEINKENQFKEIDFGGKDNPAQITHEFFSEEQIDELAKEYNSEKVLSLKVPLKFEKFVEDIKKQEKKTIPIKTHFKVFIKKTKFGNGMDDVIRGTMPVSDLRVLDKEDAYGLVLIDDAPAIDFFKMAEPPNHRQFEQTKELTNSYEKFAHQILLLKKSIRSIKSIIEDRENKQSITATQGFFSWAGGEDEGESKKNNSGEDTTKKISDWIFENPKAYNIKKISKDKLVGFEVASINFEDECKKRIQQITKILDSEKYEKTKSKINQLEQQKEKLKKWSKGENLNELFPATIFVKCTQDIEGESYEKSNKLHDKNLDYDFSNKIKNNFQEEKNGDIKKIEFKNNDINISVSGANFSYKFLFDAIINEHTGEAFDLAVSSKISRKN